MKRVYNFSAGPAVLPEEVLEQAAREMMSYGDSGMSVMEMSHRSAVYEGILNEAIADLRDLMGISDEYEVMFIQGGASTQFAMIPMNLMGRNGKADFINSGQWSKKAIAQAKAYGDVKVIATSEDKTFSYIPSWDSADSEAMRTISISAATIPSTAPALRRCRRRATCRWWPICPPAFCRSPAM